MRSDLIVAEARKWIGTPFRHQGRNKFGIDCAGLVELVGKEFGLVDLEYKANYSRRASGDRPFRQYFLDAGMTEVIQHMRPGDVIITRDNHYPCHCGFYSLKHGQPHIIHAYLPRRKVVEEPIANYDGMIDCVMRFRNVEK